MNIINVIKKINHYHFSIIYIVFASILSYLVINSNEALSNLKEIVVLSLLKIGIFYVSAFFLIKPLYRFDFDILKEVFEKKNNAAAIFLAGVMLSIALLL